MTSLISALSGVLAAVAFTFFYLSLGQFLVGLLDRQQRLTCYEKVFSSFYTGMGAWYFAATALGLTGNFKRNIIGFIILVVIGLTFIKTKDLLKNFYNEALSDLKRSIPDTKFWKFIFCSIILFILLYGVSFIAPIEGDGAAFYMAISKMLAHSGYLEKFPGYENFSAVGLLCELQMASLLLFVSDYAAKGFSFVVFLPTILVFVELARKFKLTLEATLIMLLSVFTSTGILFILYGGKIDLFSTSLGLSGLYFLMYSRQYFLSGFLLALACVAKLSLLIPFFPMVAIGLINRWWVDSEDKRKMKDLVYIVSLVGLAFIVVFIPHLIKNQFFFSNPLAPFYGTSLKWETEWFSPETTRRIILTYPLVWFYGDYWAQAGRISLLILLFLPFAYRGLQKAECRREVILTSVMFLGGMSLWLVLRPSFVAPRYIMPVLLLLAPLAGYGFDRLREVASGRFFYRALQVVLVLWVVHSLITVDRSGLSPRKIRHLFIGTEPCVLDHQHCLAAEAINQVAPMGARILQLNYFTYWLRPDLLQTLMHAEEFDVAKMNAEQVWTSIYKRDFKYLLYDTATHQYLEETYHLKDLPSWVVLKPIFTQDNVTAYEIDFTKAPVDTKDVTVVSNGEGHWQVQDQR